MRRGRPARTVVEHLSQLARAVAVDGDLEDAAVRREGLHRMREVLEESRHAELREKRLLCFHRHVEGNLEPVAASQTGAGGSECDGDCAPGCVCVQVCARVCVCVCVCVFV